MSPRDITKNPQSSSIKVFSWNIVLVYNYALKLQYLDLKPYIKTQAKNPKKNISRVDALYKSYNNYPGPAYQHNLL